MNDTLREYFSYGKFLIPLLTVKKEVVPDEYCAGVFLKERSDFKTLDKVFLELDSI